MAFLNLLFVTLLIQGFSFKTATSYCPDANCENPPDGVSSFRTQDPENCHNYYICLKIDDAFVLQEESYPCPAPTPVFDATQRDCVPGDTCEIECQNGGKCGLYECPATVVDEMIPEMYNCSAYKTCSDDTRHVCDPSNPFFDGTECQQDESKCCHCKPYCDKDAVILTKVQDPLDCSNYYVCIEGNSIPEDKMSCAEGHFNPITSECDVAYPCTTMCENVVGCDGCIDIFTCKEEGYFPRCPQRCDNHYYHCFVEDIGKVVEAQPCSDSNYVFNPDKGSCGLECPYDPPTVC